MTIFRSEYIVNGFGKHKIQRLVFNPANQKLNDFLDELQKLGEDAFGVDAQAIIQ